MRKIVVAVNEWDDDHPVLGLLILIAVLSIPIIIVDRFWNSNYGWGIFSFLAFMNLFRIVWWHGYKAKAEDYWTNIMKKPEDHT